MPITPVAVAVVLGLLTLLYIVTGKKKGENRPLLKLPLIGDIHSSSIEKPLLNWDSWTKENGPIAVPKLFGVIPIVVLNSYEAVTELFSRRSQWYSNRPPSVSMEMITRAEPGKSKFTLMHDYDDHLKFHHRILAPSLGALAAPQYHPLMELESKQLLFDLTNAARQFPQGISTETIYPLLERTQSSVILALHYGLRIPSFEEPILHEIIEIQTQVDLYMRLFRHGRDSTGWNSTKQAIATAKKYSEDGVPDLDLAFTLATSIQEGMETSPRQLLWLFIAGLHEPSFMARAHALLDQVVGRDRLPQFSDRPGLAYIDAIMHELFRWRPISPGSIPRRADRDDEFNGVKIKKGVTLMANAWAIGRDEKVFDPALGHTQDFVPERWLRRDADGEERLRTDLPLPVFGQGRRICQGKKVATDGSFMHVACLLWAFDIEPADGEEVDPWAMVVAGFMTMPREIKFKLRPRGDWVLDVINKEWETAEKSLGKVMGTGVDVEDK
ncbi:Cytochrome P450 [Penicillium expansum]|uniref:Cytochrome P450 n=1 Tax=Penicillium expansum TaxID=27334 RepID=A0A0A2ILE3_PENEN|nr:Cytochrome P450 [Penicillium expansum]KGO43899.1 Cytochrome P450 [Penicillium expansum]KGO46115.1 Cytochrome P450 [Penicillium expansum]KGO57447.1 Cytochrome P450 [Penicillium expansum]